MASVPYRDAGAAPPGEVDPITVEGRQTINASPDAFGAAQGKALQEVGQTAQHLGAEAISSGKFYGQVAADDGMNQLQQLADRLRYGNPGAKVQGANGEMIDDTGYFGTRGDAALRAYKPTMDQFDEGIKGIRDSLPTPESQMEFDRYSQRVRSNVFTTLGTHYEQQFKQYAENVNKSTVQNYQTDISRDPDNEDAFNRALSDMKQASDKNVHLAGGGDEQRRAGLDAMTAAAWKTRIESIAIKEPARAAAMAEARKAELGTQYDELATHLRARADEQSGNAAGAAALVGAQQPHAHYAPSQPIFAQAAQHPGYSSPASIARVVQIESSGNPHAGAGTSHVGAGQFSEATARQVGVADRHDFAQSVVGVQRYAAINAPILTQALGRRPTDAELYVAHQQGPAGAAALFSHPDLPAVVALTPVYHGNEAAARAAIKNNGGNPDAPAAIFTQKWISKFNGKPMTAPPADAPSLRLPETMTGGADSVAAPQPAMEPGNPDIVPPHAEAVKADAYQRILNDPNLSEGARAHALQYINQMTAAQQIAEHSAEKAKKDTNDAAADEFAQAALAGKFDGLVEAITSDPRLSDWHTRASLVAYARAEAKRQATGEDDGYGKGYAEIYHRVVARPGDPERIADPAELYRLADEGGPLTGNGAAKLAAILREIRRPESASAHQTFSEIMREAKKEVSFEQVFENYKVPDVQGERIYAYRIFPEMQERFAKLLREGGDTQKFFNELPEEVRKMRDSLRSPYEMARERAKAFGTVRAEASPAQLEKEKAFLVAPKGVPQENWDALVATPPETSTGVETTPQRWAAAIKRLDQKRSDPQEFVLWRQALPKTDPMKVLEQIDAWRSGKEADAPSPAEQVHAPLPGWKVPQEFQDKAEREARARADHDKLPPWQTSGVAPWERR